jgi:hypothetical protein
VRRALAIVVACLVVAACRGDDDGDARTSSQSTTSEAPTTTATRATTATTEAPTTTTTVAPIIEPAELPIPADAAEVADLLEEAETQLRDPARDDSDLPRLGWQQDIAYLALRAHPEWLPEVVAAVSEPVQPIVEANFEAAMDIDILNQPQPSLPAEWNVRAPLAREQLVGYYREAEAASGVPWPYLAAINLVETRLGRIVGTSIAGAQGPMQFMPSSWESFGEGGDVRADRDAILAAGRYLAAAGAPADMNGALFSYNHSLRYVNAVRRYAELIIANEAAFDGYYNWQVHYETTDGTYLLPEGYTQGSGAIRLEL